MANAEADVGASSGSSRAAGMGFKVASSTPFAETDEHNSNAVDAHDDDALSWAASDVDEDVAASSDFDEVSSQTTFVAHEDSAPSADAPSTLHSRSASGSSVAAPARVVHSPAGQASCAQGNAPAICFSPNGWVVLVRDVSSPAHATPTCSYVHVGALLHSGFAAGAAYAAELDQAPHPSRQSHSPFAYREEGVHHHNNNNNHQQPPAPQPGKASRGSSKTGIHASSVRGAIARRLGADSNNAVEPDTINMWESFAGEQAEQCKSGSSEAGLWLTLAALLRHSASSNGRSTNASPSTAPQQTLSELLRLALCSSKHLSCGTSKRGNSYVQAREDSGKAAEAEALLQSGDKEGALNTLLSGNCFAPALVLANTMDAASYQKAVASLCRSTCGSGTPIQVALFCLSEQGNSLPGLNPHDDQWAPDARWLRERWRECLCTMAASASASNTQQAMVALGDSLWQAAGDVFAAHTAYAVSGVAPSSISMSLQPHGEEGTRVKPRLCLLGANHIANPRTFATPTSIRRTLVLEHVYKQQIQAVQPYKLLLAWKLAEVGKISEAISIADEVVHTVQSKRDQASGMLQRANALRDRFRQYSSHHEATGARTSSDEMNSSTWSNPIIQHQSNGAHREARSLRHRASHKLRSAFEGFVSSLLGEDESVEHGGSTAASHDENTGEWPASERKQSPLHASASTPASLHARTSIANETDPPSNQVSMDASNGHSLRGTSNSTGTGLSVHHSRVNSAGSTRSDPTWHATNTVFANEGTDEEIGGILRRAGSGISKRLSGIAHTLAQHANVAGHGQDELAANGRLQSNEPDMKPGSAPFSDNRNSNMEEVSF